MSKYGDVDPYNQPTERVLSMLREIKVDVFVFIFCIFWLCFFLHSYFRQIFRVRSEGMS